MADTIYEWATNGWMNSLMCGGVYDTSSPLIAVNDINIPIPPNISTQSIDIILNDDDRININNTPYTPIDIDLDIESSPYDDLTANSMYHIEQFTNPIPNNSDINTLRFIELNPQNHTMITYGVNINKTSSKQHQSQPKTMHDIDIAITLEATQCDDDKSIEKQQKLEIITQEIEIQYVEDILFDDEYDEEIAINSDSSSTQSSSDGISDYIPSALSEESFYIQSVQYIIINESDYTNQPQMSYNAIF